LETKRLPLFLSEELGKEREEREEEEQLVYFGQISLEFQFISSFYVLILFYKEKDLNVKNKTFGVLK